MLFCRGARRWLLRSAGRALDAGALLDAARAFWRSSAAAASLAASSSSLARSSLSAAASFAASSAASAAASEGVSCAELARPVRIAAHPLGGLGETVATAARSSPDAEPFSLDAAAGRLRRRERISRTRPTSPSASRVSRLDRCRRRTRGGLRARARARLVPSVTGRPRFFLGAIVQPRAVLLPAHRLPRAVVVRCDCNSGRVASERARVGGDGARVGGVRGGERAFVSRTVRAVVGPYKRADQRRDRRAGERRALRRFGVFHAAVAAGESLRSPRTRRALTRAGSFSVFPRARCSTRSSRGPPPTRTRARRERSARDAREERSRQQREAKTRIYTNARLRARKGNR